MSVPLSGKQSFQHRLGCLLMEPMSGGAGEALRSPPETSHRRPCAADLPQRRRGPGFPLTISANRARRTEMILPSWAKPGDRLIQEASWSLEIVRPSRASSRKLARMPSAPCGRGEDRRDRRGRYSVVRGSHFQVPHEPACRQPEIVPHHHDRLDMLAVALPQGGDQFGVLLSSVGMEPLLELVQDQQHLLPGRKKRPSVAGLRQRIDQPQSEAVRDKPSASP